MPDVVPTIKEVAALLEPAERAVYARAQGRIKRTELDQWLDAQPHGGDGGLDGDA